MWLEGEVLILTLMLVDLGPPYFGVRFFVGWFVNSPPLLLLILRTSVVLRTIGDPNHDVFLVRRELCNLLVIGVVCAL